MKKLYFFSTHQLIRRSFSKVQRFLLYVIIPVFVALGCGDEPEAKEEDDSVKYPDFVVHDVGLYSKDTSFFNAPGERYIEVYLNENRIGNITKAYTFEPGCSAAGTLKTLITRPHYNLTFNRKSKDQYGEHNWGGAIIEFRHTANSSYACYPYEVKK